MAAPADAVARAQALREQLEYHNHRYYVLDAPEVGPSDYQDRSYNTAVLLNTGWFVAMLPLLRVSPVSPA